MPNTLNDQEREDITREILHIRSGVVLASWAVFTLNEQIPEESAPRFELYEGLGYLLELMACELSDVRGKLHTE